MPVYSFTTNKPISERIKDQLVDMITDSHCSIMIAPEQFVHVLFMDGIPIFGNKKLYIHANVRAGRKQKTIDKLYQTIATHSSRILKVSTEKIHLNLIEIQAKWVMEGGYVMPEPGEEEEWMEKVTKALDAAEKIRA